MGVFKINKCYKFYNNVVGEFIEIDACMANFVDIFQCCDDSDGAKHLGSHNIRISKLQIVADASLYDSIFQNGPKYAAFIEHLLLNGIFYYLLY